MKRIRENTKAAALLILAAGGMLRLFYVCFSTIYDRQYDIGLIDLDAGHTVTGGHLAYIQYLYENWRMPDFDPTSVYQFHHPPLHHFLCAAWMKFVSLFIKDTAVVEESIQAIPFVCSLLILWVLLRIVRQFDLQERTVRYLMALFAFHPALVLLSGSVNNDCLALLFTLLCVCYAIEWGRAPSMGCIGKLALVLGLGMMTKQSVAEMAFPIGAVFLYVLLVRIREGGLWGKSVKDLARQFGIFGLISVPLGMWFYVRNLLRYQVSFLWVYELPEDYFRNSESKEAMHEVNMELRIDEHSKAINDDLNWLSFKCGFGTDRYRFEGGQVKTATEVISENSDMYRSLTKHELVLKRVLIQLVQTIIRAGISIGIPGLQEGSTVTVRFDDSIIQDKAAERQSDRQDVAMGAMSVPEYRSKWYGETMEQARQNLPEQFDSEGGAIP